MYFRIFFFMSFVNKEIAVLVGVNMNDQIFFLMYKYHTIQDIEYICFFPLSCFTETTHSCQTNA